MTRYGARGRSGPDIARIASAVDVSEEAGIVELAAPEGFVELEGGRDLRRVAKPCGNDDGRAGGRRR